MTENPPFVLRGKLSSLIAVNAFGLILGCVLFYLYIRFSPHYGAIGFLVGCIILLVWLTTDALCWYYRGVHELVIEEDRIRALCGKTRKEKIILVTEITDFYVNQRRSRKTMQILLGNTVKKIPGIYTYYPGPKLMLTSDAFNDSEFDEAIGKISDLLNKQGKNGLINRYK